MEMRRVEVGDVTWLVTECRGCPMKRKVKCSLTLRIAPIDGTIPKWCPLERMQVRNEVR